MGASVGVLKSALGLAAALAMFLPQQVPVPQAPAAGSEEAAPVMLILDASGSMLNPDADAKGTLRMDAAKAAASELVETLPAGSQLGLMVYGTNTDSSPEARAEGCKDVTVLSELGTADPGKLLGQIDSIKAAGYTPVGEALRRAAAELPDDGPRSIVLVSDGIDTCSPPPPCEVAKDLAKDGVDLAMHTIGFKVDAQARKELECIAKASGGTYADADNADTLREQMVIKTVRALNPYDFAGIPVTGGKSAAGAAEVSTGQYLDTFATGSKKIYDGGTRKFYKVHLDDGERLHVSASLVMPIRSGSMSTYSSLELEVLGSVGQECLTSVREARDEARLSDGPVTAVLSTPALGSGDKECLESADGGDLVISVTRSGPGWQDDALPMELLFLTEPEADTAGLPEAYDSVTTLALLKPGAKPQETAPGNSFNSAPELAAGSYTATLIPGEVHFYKVPVDYGQQLRAVAKLGDYQKDIFNPSYLQLGVANPLRQPVTITDGTSTGAYGMTSMADPGTTVAANFASPVRYRNAAEGAHDVRTLYLAGDYYLQVAVDPLYFEDAKETEIPYTLSLDLVGDVEPGPGAAEPEATPAETAVAEPADNQAATQTIVAAADDDDGSPLVPALAWSIGSAVVIAAGVAAAVILRRKRGVARQ
ncbi:MAG: vWA domain-containing protein [Actinomycetota bacterium]